MTKADTTTNVTAKRKVFLKALKIIKAHQQADEIDCFAAVDDLELLLDDAPRSGWLAEEWAICSALWASEDPGHPEVDDIHEHCKGGELFLVAYFLGRRSALRRQRAR